MRGEPKIKSIPVPAPAKIPVLGMYGDPAWHGHKETTIDKAFEGSPSTNYKNCYVSNNNKNDKAEIYIPRSKVVQIKLLNRADCCSESFMSNYRSFNRETYVPPIWKSNACVYDLLATFIV